LAAGVTAGDAILVDAELLARVRGSSEFPGEPTDVVSLAELARVLKLYACQKADVAVTDPFVSPKVGFRDRRRLLHQQFGELVVAVQALLYLMLLASLVLAPLWGLAATLILHIQPLFVTLGTRLSPSDRFAHTLFRSLIDVVSAFGPTPMAKPEATAATRAVYERLLARGTAPFFEPARNDCPVCGGRTLSTAFEVGDRHQFKPGRFKVAQCDECGHRFQNPRLSVEGLEFYYRDFYDGLGKDRLERIFASSPTPYVDRARMVAAVTTPRTWLDVGAGHGHFCNVARDVLPETAFDGLDIAGSIDDAERRGWINRGIRGLFGVVAPQIEASGELYDVVSMSHYLEHTVDPRTEIAAAARVLHGGGLLMIEVPDPECGFGRLLGRHWMPWFQPQHLNFLSVKNLERLLAEYGFSTVACDRGEAHLPTDFFFVTFLAIENLAPPAYLPWRPPTGLVAVAWRRVVWFTMFPLLLLAILLDRLLVPFTRRPGWSNAYRLLAKKAEGA
jgi:SAM-dependent methyltransferase